VIEPSSTADPAATFPFGVASGDPDQRSVTLWTRVADDHGDRPLDWFLAPLDGRGDLAPTGPPPPPARSGTVTPSSEDDRTVHVTVEGLEPGHRFRFGFCSDGVTVEGRTRTLPAAADHLRFVVACCSRWGWPGFDRYGDIVDEDPAFVLHLGDYIYESGEPGPGGAHPDPPYDCVTLDDYRRRYRQHRSHPGLQRLHGAVPFIITWDDHEVVNNAPGSEPLARRKAGQRAWREWLPMRRPVHEGEGDTIPIDRRLSIDGLVDLALVDTRFGGRQPLDTDGPAAEPDHGPILSGDQWGDLTRFAGGATAPWLVVASQVQVGPMTLGWLPSPGWPPVRRVVNPDQWDGHPTERDRLYQLLDQATGRPVILSGDLHSGWSRELGHRSRTIAHEFTAPSISGESYGAGFRDRTRLPPAVLGWVLRAANRGIDLLELDRHGYLVCDLTPATFTTTFVLGDRVGGRIGGEPDRVTRSLAR
jgi:phosphodiesterase/alkaline phosphatase D-like protein